MIYSHITELIGNTPLLRLDPRVHGLAGVELYAKLESHNPFGSVKDRIAWSMIRDDIEAVAAGGQSFIEASSGNTAKALRVLGALHGVPLRAVTNRIRVTEVRQLLQLLGTDIVELPGLSECPDPHAADDVSAVIEHTTGQAPERWYHPSQYTNERNVEAHRDGTGAEIAADLAAAGIEHLDYLVGGLGTTGSTRGTATALLAAHPALRTIGVVSDRFDFIPGIRSEREMWDVGLFRPDFYHDIVTVDSATAIDATLDLVRGYGVLAGPTSGAGYAAALRTLADAPRPEDRPLVAVLVVCDRLEPYLSYFAKRRPDLFGAPEAPPAPDTGSAPALTPAELAELDRIGRPMVVDTRGAMAYRVGHIPGAVNLRDDQLDDMLGQGMPFPRSRPIVFVCPVGEASLRFAALTRQAGYEAFSLAGGIVAWRDAGLPLERG
ncbi:pyridoxal-phosphate dependent enzyme [Nocardia rosealba]|uniref:pyridoxal-phosphate dependent enzyme n=1 Tax=Nocardia rosealba TaxID=2878563 RepID=UPI001CD99ECA|nr:pyridoxal-phosphate dependent enzyme [Nocardia rosealba]MCA2207353.1 pyridoxal-phosphate dependent enzyme [Nocardia rosealba]